VISAAQQLPLVGSDQKKAPLIVHRRKRIKSARLCWVSSFDLVGNDESHKSSVGGDLATAESLVNDPGVFSGTQRASPIPSVNWSSITGSCVV
jgi:hypothetical protein